MLALSTTRCGVVRLFTNRSKRLRSPRRNRILRTGSPMRGICRMYLLCRRFLLHYTSGVTSDPTKDHRGWFRPAHVATPASISFSCARPLWMYVFAVPRGTPMMSAISSYP